jgi:hypothetical protein
MKPPNPPPRDLTPSHCLLPTPPTCPSSLHPAIHLLLKHLNQKAAWNITTMSTTIFYCIVSKFLLFNNHVRWMQSLHQYCYYYSTVLPINTYCGKEINIIIFYSIYPSCRTISNWHSKCKCIKPIFPAGVVYQANIPSWCNVPGLYSQPA